MKRLILLSLLYALNMALVLAQEYQPIKIMGFNQDVVAEGIGRDTRATTTREMDAIVPSNNIICTRQFAQTIGLPRGYGLPDNGKLISGKRVYQLGDFSSNNAVYLFKGDQAELKLFPAQRFDGLSILGLATEGPAFINMMINFTDGTSIRSVSLEYADWYDGPNPVIQGFGRVKRAADSKVNPLGYEGAPTNPRMYAVDISIPNGKEVRSILFHNVSQGPNRESNRVFIFAISGFIKQQDKVVVPVIVPVVVVPEKKKEVVSPVKEEVVKEVPGLHGTISDARNKAPLQATIRFSSNGVSSDLKTVEGKYRLVSPGKVEYTIKITASGYLDLNEKINLQSSWPANDEMNFALQPIEVGTLVNLKSVLFRQSTATLLEQSYPELDAVAEFLRANPNVRIELAGHTDNQGSKKSNLKLSNDRVTEVKKYLVGKGIGTERITGQGYGGTKPIAPNDSEESRKLNRRVEFVITNK